MTSRIRFGRVVFVDFEFSAADGETPKPICVVHRIYGDDRSHRTWLDGAQLHQPPYPVDDGTLFVAYYASAEIGCHLALGWPIPALILDLYAEFRCLTNGRRTPCGSGLLGAQVYFGIGRPSGVEKSSMRDLALKGGPWNAEEERALLDYCATDVRALESLYEAMRSNLDVDRALLRGRYMAAVAQMESTGIPVDKATFNLVAAHWSAIKKDIVEQADESFGAFRGSHFVSSRWQEWLKRKGIPWPRADSGQLLLDEETFSEMAKLYPEVSPMHDLRQLLGQLRPPALTVGSDGRNRCILSAFQSLTGRNQPSNAKFVFGAPSWLRGLVRPEPGHGLAYMDWSQQEFGIAAALSDDGAMIAAYKSGDPYLAFAIQTGLAPTDATKESHREIRDQAKQCVLGVQYGMGPETLASRIGRPPIHARHLLDLHRRTYPRFWTWSAAAVDYARIYGEIQTVFGWPLHVTHDTRWRTIANFPMQANGAEMLRLACTFATELGVRVCAPIHDAMLVEAPEQDLKDAVAQTQRAMGRASRSVLAGFELRTEVRLLDYPQRLIEPRGEATWKLVMNSLARTLGAPISAGELEHLRHNAGSWLPTPSLSSKSSTEISGGAS